MESSETAEFKTVLSTLFVIAIVVAGFLFFKSQNGDQEEEDFYKAQISVSSEDCNFGEGASAKTYLKWIKSVDIEKIDEGLKKIINHYGDDLRVEVRNKVQEAIYISGREEIYVDVINYNLLAEVSLVENIMEDIGKLVVAPDISENDLLMDEVLQAERQCDQAMQSIKALADREWFYLDQLEKIISERQIQPTRSSADGETTPPRPDGMDSEEYLLVDKIIQIRQEAQQQINDFKSFLKNFKEKKLGKVHIQLHISGFPG